MNDVEYHHIIPICAGGENTPRKQEFNCDGTNLIGLTIKEHIFVHHLLTKIYKNTQYFKSLGYAYHMMIYTRNKKISLKQAVHLRQYMIKDNNPQKNPLTRAKTSQTLIGHSVSIEARQKMSMKRKGKSPANKGKPLPEHLRLKLHEQRAITNGQENKFISKNDPLPNGWRYGITRKKPNYHTHMIPINNGQITKYIEKKRTNTYGMDVWLC